MAFDATRSPPPDEPLIAIPGTRLVHLTRGVVALIDNADWVEVSSYLWHAHPSRGTWYARNRKVGYLHQLIVKAQPGQVVDHRNRNGLDCRRDNLRVAGFDQNAQNADYKGTGGTGFRGVTKTAQGKYRARIKVAGQTRDLGTFFRIGDAVAAYDAAALQVFGQYAWTNLDNRPLTDTSANRVEDIPF